MRVTVLPSPVLSGTVHIPGSKNYTSRYLLAAALASGESLVQNPAPIDDAHAMVDGCRALGAKVRWVDGGGAAGAAGAAGAGPTEAPAPGVPAWRVEGTGGKLRAPGTLSVRNAGAVARFLTAICALSPEPVNIVTPYPESLGRRPQDELLDALEQLGASVERLNGGRLPVRIGGPRADGRRLRGGPVRVSGARSSQFVSALLFLTPLLEGESRIEVVDELRSRPAVRQTLAVLREAGIHVEAPAFAAGAGPASAGSPNHSAWPRGVSEPGGVPVPQPESGSAALVFRVPGGQRYRAGRFVVPGDWPSAAAVMAAAAVTASDVRLCGLMADDQGEREAVEVLARMGVDIRYDPAAGEVRVWGRGGERPGDPGEPGGPDGLSGPASPGLRPVEFDGDRATDAVMALVAAACFADGVSRFYNIENLRYKESDRISDFCAELRKAGAHVEEERDAIIVHGNRHPLPGGVEIDAHHDHRLLMAMSIVGLRCRQPLVLRDAEHIGKSYPAFFEHLRSLGARVVEGRG